MAISTVKDCADIINESLKTLGYEYQIDTTSNTTIEEGLNKIGAFPPSQRNTIMEQMNLIIQARNYGVMFDASKNAFRRFLVSMDEGFGIEDIFHELIDGIDPLWDDTTAEGTQKVINDLYSYDANRIHKFFHTDSVGKEFKTTIDRRNYDKVFLPSRVTRYVDAKLANLSWSAEVWLMQFIISIIKTMIANGHVVFKEGFNPNTKDGVATLVEDINATSDGFLTPSKLYNLGVPNSAGGFDAITNITNSKEDIFLVTTPELMRRLKTRGYSNAFNLSEFELSGQIMYLPAGTDLGQRNGKEVLAIALDRRAIVCGLFRWVGTSKFIENTLCMNHFLLTEVLYGYNTVFNCVAFVGDALGDYSGGEGGNLIVSFTNTDPVTSNYVYEVDGIEHTTKGGFGTTLSYAGVKTASFPMNGSATTPFIGSGLKVNGVNISAGSPAKIENGELVFDNITGTIIVEMTLAE